jgi:hypothetical protein
MGGEFHRLVMVALAAGLLVIPGCGAGDGSHTGTATGTTQAPPVTTAAIQPKITSAALESGNALRVTYTEVMKAPTGVDPSKFRLTVAYFTRPASGSDKYSYAYYAKGYGYGYNSQAHTIYSELGDVAAITTDGINLDQTVLQLGSTFSADAACKQIAALNAANPNAHAGLYLHYSEAGSPTIEDSDGNKLASLAAYWAADPTIEQVSGDFVGKPIPVALTCSN